MRGRVLRVFLPGLPVSAVIAVLVFFLVSWSDSTDEEPSGQEPQATAQPDRDVTEAQAEIFLYEVVAAREATRLAPTPTPEPTPTPVPSPFEIAQAELPYAVPPPNVAYGPDERWIGVNVTTQRAYAFVGGKAVHVALVTTGMPGYETPLGEFRINYRKEKDIMDSETMGVPHDDPEGYYLEDVYFAQYFAPGYALHSNYWRPISYFGNVASSHGCVGMLYDDAKFFWDFATYGTRVVVYR